MNKSKSRRTIFIYEKFKAVLLVCLIILCIVQIGILWSNQSHSSPISLFLNSSSKSNSPVSIDDSKGDFLLPYRIAISTGFDGEHYVIPNGSKDYNTLWDGAKQYIDQALESKPQNIQPFNEDYWGTLVANKPYVFEFKTQIPIEIIKWTLNLEDNKGDGLSSIYKIVVCPDDSDNSYADTLYIRDDKNIYTYGIKNVKNNSLNYSVFNEVYSAQKSNASYQMAIEKYRKFEISKDLMSVFSGKKLESYPDITCEAINGLNEKEYTYDDFNDMAQDLFGNARIDYDFDVDVNGSVVFKKSDGVYRLYKNSILEYNKYTPNKTNTEELNVLESYKKALSYLLENKSQNDMMSNITLYLNSFKEIQNQGAYIFNFDYSISLGEEKGEIPILLKDYKIPIIESPLNNSISIEASSKNVLSFKWLALKFYVNNNIENYEWSFVDMYSKLYDKYSELKNEFSAKDFGMYYVVNKPEMQEYNITPSFVLFTKDGAYDILMEANNK